MYVRKINASLKMQFCMTDAVGRCKSDGLVLLEPLGDTAQLTAAVNIHPDEDPPKSLRKK